MPPEELIAKVPTGDCYQIKFRGKEYNVEVQILENREDYIHVGISVDDGSLPTSLHPLSESLIQKKSSPVGKTG
jgi:hypothetical protein